MKNKKILRVLSAVLSGILLLETPMSSFAEENTQAVLKDVQETEEQQEQEDSLEETKQEEVKKETKEEIEISLEDANLLDLELVEQTNEGVFLKFVPQEEISFYELYRKAEDEEEEILLAELENTELEKLEEDGSYLYLDEVSEAHTYTYWIYGYSEKLEEEMTPVAFGGFVEIEISEEETQEEEKESEESEEEETQEETKDSEAVEELPDSETQEETKELEENQKSEEIKESEDSEKSKEVEESEEEAETEEVEEIEEAEEAKETTLEDNSVKEESAQSSAVESVSIEEVFVEETSTTNTKETVKEAVIETKETNTTSSDKTTTSQTETVAYLSQAENSVGYVKNLKVVATAYNKIKITWDKLEGAKGYFVYYKTPDMSTYQQLKTQSSNSYIFTKAVCGVTYSFQVTPYQKINKQVVEGVAVTSDTIETKLDIPTLSASKVTYTKAILKWKKIAGAKKYEIVFSDSINGTYTPVNALTGKAITGASYTHQANSGAGKTYYYKIRAVRDNYVTEYSDPITVTFNHVEVTQGKVQNLQATVTAYNKIKLTWNKQTKANGYEIWYKKSTESDTAYTLLKKQGGVTYNFTNAECGVTYDFKVRSYQKADGITYEGLFSDTASAKADLVVSTLQVSKSSYTQVALKWSKVTGATGYTLSISESQNGPYTEVATVTSTSYTHIDLEDGKTYYYKLNAIRNAYIGADSNIVSATLLPNPLKTQVVKNLTALPTAYNTIKLSWDAISGVKGYKIYYRTGKTTEYTELTSLASNTYTFGQAECGETYYFSVRAYQTYDGVLVYTDYSAEASAITELTAPTPVLTSVAYNKVVINWTKITGATSYEVYVSTSSNGTYTSLGTTTGNSYTHTDVKINTTYYYKLKAVRNNYNTELSSDFASATVLYNDLTNVKAKSNDDGTIKISWTSVPGMTNYVIERYTSEEDAYNRVNDTTFETTGTSYTDSGLTVNTTYYYMVYGENSSYMTNIEGPVSATTKIVESSDSSSDSSYTRYGVDVSSYQGNINWGKVYDSGIRFAMLRILVKSGNKDTKFEENYTNARAAGVKVGVYKYTYAKSASEAKAEAKAVIAALNGRKLDYPVALDLEDTTQANLTTAERTAIVLAYKKVVEAAGYDFVVYASYDWFVNRLDMNQLADVELWIARWRSFSSGHGYTGKGKVTMWQYSDAGKVNGISGNVDLDVSYKRY